MAKFISKSQLIGEKGVAAFHKYCASQNPQILFREKTKHDFGIDAEIELVRKTSEGKFEVTGEILAVQIKSSESDSGYIKKETDTVIEIAVRKEDLEYWNRYKNAVLFVFYDGRNDQLFCRKINHEDNTFISKGLNQSIVLSKIDDKLIAGDDNILNRYSKEFKERVNYSSREYINTNLYQYKKLPKLMYRYNLPPTITNKEKFYGLFQEKTSLKVVIYNNIVYSFENLIIIDELKGVVNSINSGSMLPISNIRADKDLQNHYIELLNLYLKDFSYQKGLVYSKEYRRYYFHKPKESNTKSILVKHESRNNTKPKKVVEYYEYGKDKFFRHSAVEFQHLFIDGYLYLSILPKYLFTKDGKETLEPKLITKYTNYLTMREFNKQVLGNIRFIFRHLSDGNIEIIVYANNNFEIAIGTSYTPQVNFGIPLDCSVRKKLTHSDDSSQQTSLQF
jgi:hypothetical protein